MLTPPSTTVRPAPVIVPELQLNDPDTARSACTWISPKTRLNVLSMKESVVIEKVPPLIWMAASLESERIVTLSADEMVLLVKAEPICTSSSGPGSTSPIQLAGACQSAPVPEGPPSQWIAASSTRCSNRSKTIRRNRRGKEPRWL